MALMRLLRLTNSYDTDPAIAKADNKKTVVERLFQEATGEPIETTVRVIWPDPVLPELVDKWMTCYRPDVVLLIVVLVHLSIGAGESRAHARGNWEALRRSGPESGRHPVAGAQSAVPAAPQGDVARGGRQHLVHRR